MSSLNKPKIKPKNEEKYDMLSFTTDLSSEDNNAAIPLHLLKPIFKLDHTNYPTSTITP